MNAATQIEHLDCKAFVTRYYGERITVQNRIDIYKKLKSAQEQFSPVGFFLAECHDMSSSHLGDKPFSPRGLASDMSVAVAYLLVEDLI